MTWKLSLRDVCANGSMDAHDVRRGLTGERVDKEWGEDAEGFVEVCGAKRWRLQF